MFFLLEESNDQINSENVLHFEEEYPTDRGLFEENINDNLKRSILHFGPCKPAVHFPSNIQGRQFSTKYYQVTMKSGLIIPRIWLCYSIILDKAYCETCWLFADRTYGNFKFEWVNGMNDWHHLSQCLQRHEISIQHFEALKVRYLWVKNQTVDANLEKQYSKEATKWRNVLKRLIKIILTITSGNTALRGNEGSLKIQNPTEGNFLRIVNLLSEFDPILNNLLSNEKQKI